VVNNAIRLYRTLKTKGDIMILKTGKPGISPFYIQRAESLLPSWVSEWDRVQANRKAGKCKGGNYREWERTADPLFIAYQKTQGKMLYK